MEDMGPYACGGGESVSSYGRMGRTRASCDLEVERSILHCTVVACVKVLQVEQLFLNL